MELPEILLDSNVQSFLWGTLGSCAIELSLVMKYYYSGGNFPKRYKSKLFYFLRMCYASVGGALAIASATEQPLFAFHIGAGLPLILEKITQTPQYPSAVTQSANAIEEKAK